MSCLSGKTDMCYKSGSGADDWAGPGKRPVSEGRLLDGV